jgi:predicted helicase
MASYAMAHFKLDMKLKETEYTGDGTSRLKVYLTNSLEEPPKDVPELFMEKWLTDEAIEANKIKKNTPVMVVLGNPPYSGESANITSDEFLAPYKKEPGGKEKLREKNPKWLNDDYVKFIRYGQTFIEKYGVGVLAFINNHGFLDNPTFRGMRWHLLKTFDKMYILNLHGNSKKKETCPDGSKDENVFDIQQGVSINLFVKTGRKKDDKLADIFYTDLFGKRETKYSLLFENTIDSINWKRIEPVHPYFFFAPKDFSHEEDYTKGFSVQELFPICSNGLFTARDSFTIHFTKQKAIDNINEFLLLDNETARRRFGLGEDVRDWSVIGARNDLTANPDFNKIVEINYRPFDNRYTYYTGHTKGFHCMPRGKFMRHFIEGKNFGLIIGRQGQAVGSMEWNLISLTSSITDLNIYYRGGGVIFPLYLYSFDNTSERHPNLRPDMVNTIADKINLRFTEEKTDDRGTFAPIDIFDYIYAVLHSPAYRTQYKEFLKIDFPRIPYPKNADEFCRLATIGSILRNLHLMENVSPSHDKATFPVAGSNEITMQKYESGKVFINKTQHFDKVPLETWEFYIGGYQPARKWLKDRAGHVLTFDEIEHYRKIITVLSLTIDIQQQIDEVIGR